MRRLLLFVLLVPAVFARAAPVTTVEALVAAVRDAAEGTTVEIAPGTYAIPATLELKAGLTLRGAGMDRTILTGADGWDPATAALPDPEMRLEGLDTNAYLVRVKRDTAGVTVSDLTLRGPRVHGAIFAWFATGLHLHHLRVEDTRWSGIRTFGMTKARIHDCEFIDAGGRWEKGRPGVNGGITGGGIFAVWMEDSEIFDNRFTRRATAPEREYYGIKVRQAKRCRVWQNTIATNFAMEFPFENDEDVEIDHNVCHGTVSLPKHAGGPVPASGRTFRLHHNLFTDSYAIEFVRNGIEIDHNLFDFDPARDHGNLISGFGQAAAAGPASFHHNLVNNPGRGVVWIDGVFNRLEIHHNHIRARTTATPRTEGLFGFNPASDFGTMVICDNIIECEGQARPLFRNAQSLGIRLENNRLVNVSGAETLKNPSADRPAGPGEPLRFRCGVRGEITVDQWETRPTPVAEGRVP